MSSRCLTNDIKAEALRLGFFACGVAKAAPVSASAGQKFVKWTETGGHAGMGYMANHLRMRLDPRLLMEGVKSIICVALNYTPAHTPPDNELQLAAYALGQDYHDIMKEKLRLLANFIRNQWGAVSLDSETYQDTPAIRVFCDTAPILERYWAQQAGLGWTGRNHQLIIPHAGSQFFLGELFVDVELDYDTPTPNRCGSCHACVDACPTQALTHDSFRAERCLSYLTIENREDIPTELADKMGNCIYGCDRCQQACPWNRFATPTAEPRLQPKQELLDMTREKWHTMTEDDYRRLFKGSAVKRAKYAGLMRNIQAADGNISENDS